MLWFVISTIRNTNIQKNSEDNKSDKTFCEIEDFFEIAIFQNNTILSFIFFAVCEAFNWCFHMKLSIARDS